MLESVTRGHSLPLAVATGRTGKMEGGVGVMHASKVQMEGGTGKASITVASVNFPPVLHLKRRG